MSGTRSRKEVLHYMRYIKNLPQDPTCEFCDVTKDRPTPVKAGKYFTVINNIFPYSLWDEKSVLDHLMIVPKKHTDTLKGLPDLAAIEYVKILGEYEALGYNSYARAPGSQIKTIVHHHTHLIKSQGRRRSLLIHLRKPRIRVTI